MYSTCLFCSENLGRNEAIEHFSVGRRLAFDAAKGRLWVVCRKCERWNLTPLEERWEAIEECERAFRATKLRVSTDHIGLARIKEGTELVRIGEPQRPEMAAWRYGDQFGRRRRNQITVIAGVAAALGVVYVAGPVLGLVGGVSFQGIYQTLNAGRAIYQSKTLIPIPVGDETRHVRLSQVHDVELVNHESNLSLVLPVVPLAKGTSKWRYQKISEPIELTGDDVIRAAGAILPRVNKGGGSAKTIAQAVAHLEEANDTANLFRNTAHALQEKGRRHAFTLKNYNPLARAPASLRLALEMASHEDAERRALEGELHILEAAWKDAEEIAGIADNMFLPQSVEEDLARLKGQHRE
jgi:hypothetical protein